MTARTPTKSMDGTQISDADRARLTAEEALQARWRRRAVRVVAGAAQDVDDCRLLLDILGLDPADVASTRRRRPKPAVGKPGEPAAAKPRRRPRAA